MSKQNLKTIVRGIYDLQKLRIQTGNRIVANCKSKLGQMPSSKESELGDDEKKILDKLRLHFRKITDGILNLPSNTKFKGDNIISDYAELCLISQYLELESNEAKNFRQLEKVLQGFPIYADYLKNVRGCGPAMAGVIISEIDIHAAKYPSSIHAYAGLDVAHDGRGRSKRKEHLVEKPYTTTDGEQKTKLGITFNPFLKTKLTGVLAASFLRSKSPYADIYKNYKNRLENHPEHKDKTKLHKHNMAMRYMIKRFLVDLYIQWRTMEGLEVSPEYHEAKLGIVHGKEC